MKKLIVLLITFVSVLEAFDYVEFKRKYCYEDTDVRITAYYIPYETGHTKILPGFVCDKFVLRKDDLDYMARNNFVFSNDTNIFFKNCEIEYFNEYLVSMFPNIIGMDFDNCKISLKNPDLIATVNINQFSYLEFHKCTITDNLKTNALQKFIKLSSLLIQNSTFEYSSIDEQFLPKTNKMYNLIIDNTNVKSFSKGLMSNMPHHYQKLRCTSCDLDEIDSLLFGFKYDVTYLLSFANNNIKKLPTSLDVLANFHALPEINLSGNEISEPILERIFFKSLTNLNNLDLSRNSNLTEIGYLAFKDTFLQNLNMSNVNLKILNKLGNANLTTIDFSYNQIFTINIETFDSLVNLKFLDLSNNIINDLNTLVFKDLKSLTELRLNSNYLRILPSNIFNSLTNLQILDLSSNFLETINNAFEILKNLQYLHLQGNLLKVIPSGQGLPNSLKSFDISGNNLIFVGKNTFSNLNQLSYLDISSTNNTYIDFDRNCLQPLTSLKIFKAQGNKISSIEDIFLPNSLEELDLALNKIESATKKGLEHLSNLKSLNLSYNHMYSIESGLLEKFSKISVVDLDGNDI